MASRPSPPDTAQSVPTSSTQSFSTNPMIKFAQKIWIPFWVMCAAFSVLSASFFLGASVKTFAMFGLCGFAIFGLFQNLDSNRTILSKINHWTILALIAHTFYFNIFHSIVTK